MSHSSSTARLGLSKYQRHHQQVWASTPQPTKISDGMPNRSTKQISFFNCVTNRAEGVRRSFGLGPSVGSPLAAGLPGPPAASSAFQKIHDPRHDDSQEGADTVGVIHRTAVDMAKMVGPSKRRSSRPRLQVTHSNASRELCPAYDLRAIRSSLRALMALLLVVCGGGQRAGSEGDEWQRYHPDTDEFDVLRTRKSPLLALADWHQVRFREGTIKRCEQIALDKIPAHVRRAHGAGRR